MRILLVAILFMGMCEAVMACDSMKDCVEKTEDKGWEYSKVISMNAIAYAIEDLADAVRESK